MRTQKRKPKMDAKRAAKIANDIAAGINCGESKATLRECVRWWAGSAAKTHIELTALLTKLREDVLSACLDSSEQHRKWIKQEMKP